MKSTSITLLVVFLISLIPDAFNQHSNFNEFVTQLEQAISAQTPDILPFVLKNNVIEYLPLTSYDFQSFCIQVDNKLFSKEGRYSPVVALNASINHIFESYRQRANEQSRLIDQIKQVDPIGLNIYLTAENKNHLSPTFIASITKYHEVMIVRLRLHRMRTDMSLYDTFYTNTNKRLHTVDLQALDYICKESERIVNIVIDQFIRLAGDECKKQMYVLNPDGRVVYQRHDPNTNDVQIFYGKSPRGVGHVICTFYRASTKKVEVYDSAMFGCLSTVQMKAINILYPQHRGIEFVTPRTVQGMNRSCGYFAIAYATTLLLGEEPTETEIKLNSVYGDISLYMRIHLLNMFANQKLALFP